MFTHRLTRVLCALLMLGALVAFTGCGGDDKSSSSSSSSPDTAATTPAAGADTTDTGGSSGGGSLEDYKAGAKAAGEKFQNAAQDASAKIQAGQTLDEKLGGLEALKQGVNAAADDYAALNPPANVKAENDELVSELREFATVIDGATAAIKSKDQAKLAQALAKLPATQAKIGQTIARIQAKVGG
jgi:hypothetical protein